MSSSAYGSPGEPRHGKYKTKLTNNVQNNVLYSYDAEADTVKQWPEMSRIVAEELKTGKITPLC